MKKSEWITIGLAVATFLGTLILGSMWLGSLSERVDRLEKLADASEIGPRGEACQKIVGKLVEQPRSQDLERLSDKFGCTGFAAATGPAEVGQPAK